MLRKLRWGVLGLGVVLVATVAACGDDGDAASAQTDDLQGTVQVFAAASLIDAFEEIAEAFEADHPEVEVTPSFGGSSSLVQQILDGAPADVLATADDRTMSAVVDAGRATNDPQTFARNHLVLAVPRGNPGEVSGLDELAQGDLLVGLCAAEVPCGNLGAGFLDDQGVEAAVDTYEPDVRALLTKLTVGELDAGLVYRTDGLAAGDDMEIVDVPGIEDAATTYPIAPLTSGEGSDAVATAFVEFVLGEKGQAILADRGFAAP